MKNLKKGKNHDGNEYYYEPSHDINKYSPLCQFTQTSFDKLSGDERIVDVLKYLNQNDDSESLTSSSSTSSEKIEYEDLNEDFKTSKCLTLNNCISDDAGSTILVVNKYLYHDTDPRTREELEEFVKQRRIDLDIAENQNLLILAAYITEPDYERFKNTQK